MNWEECAIVDDNKFDRLICNRIISRISSNLNVKEYRSGKEIFDYLLSDSFNSAKLLILLDINMPEMNGYDFLEAITKPQFESISSRLQIVIITSSTRKEDQEKTAEFSIVKHYLQKPILIDSLQEIINSENQ